MKIANNQIESFVRNVPAEMCAVLIYGPDHGQVQERATVIAKQIVADLNDPFLVATPTADTVKDSPATLYDEIQSLPFLGGRKLIRLLDIPTGLGPVLEEAIPLIDPSSVFLLVTSGELPPTSKARKVFESSDPKIVAIPCYVDDARQLTTLVRETARHEKRTIENEAVDLIATYCQGDRGIIRSELQKIFLYAGDRTHIELEDVQTCLGETTETTLDHITNAVASGSYQALYHHLEKAYAQAVQPIAILRAVQRYFDRLTVIQASVDQGHSIELAMKELRPPVFFKEVPRFKGNAERWIGADGAAIRRALSLAVQAERDCKRAGALTAETLTERALSSITAIVAHGERRRVS